jgi:hypothetical protein
MTDVTGITVLLKGFGNTLDEPHRWLSVPSAVLVWF